MRPRLIPALLLLAWFAILIKVVVFKDIEIRTPWLILKLGGDYARGRANFVPFKTIWFYLQLQHGLFGAILNLGGNTLPFVPVGFLAPMVYPRITWPRALTLAVSVGLTMELMEAIFRVGIFDVDDVLLNALGVATGHWVVTRPPKNRRIAIALGAALVVTLALLVLMPFANRGAPTMPPPKPIPQSAPAASAPAP